MDQKLMTTLQSVGRSSKEDAKTALVSTFVSMGAGPHTVQGSRNDFSAVLAKARNGMPQLIGNETEGIIVAVSLGDLVKIVQVVAKGQSFGDALGAAGFKPVSGRKITVNQGIPPEPLERPRGGIRS